jgi:hypothetical protein
MIPTPRPPPSAVVNNTVKLSGVLRQRVATAMLVNGYTVWAEFCRVALTEKCQATERMLKANDPAKYHALYELAGAA